MSILIPDSIPGAPDCIPLDFAHKKLVTGLVAKHNPQVSELTFSNLIAWGKTHPVYISRIEDTLLLWRGPAKSGILLSPLGKLDAKGITLAFEMAGKMGDIAMFGRISENTANMLKDADPNLEVIEDRDSADYIYKQSAMSELPGRKLDGKRNLVRKFHKTVDAVYAPITDDLLPACADAQALWCDIRECSINADLDAENAAVEFILEHWSGLDLFGGAYLVEGEVAAFTVGEKLNEKTAVIHFEKGNTKFPGSYQAINQAFAQNALAGFEYINREQDLGIEGLRKSKMSYQPDHLLMKYTVMK